LRETQFWKMLLLVVFTVWVLGIIMGYLVG